ncbi:MAG: ribbon-helix-helix domain-containing protein [Alphaproteobacteria bacterium]|nr:ribbon-helix-helix domain-containing protein [Alphaproteobacteria bacterium]MCB9984459.1 ribbon-helix-helix domain-containing protein [Micavibrio sp.]
MTKRPPNNQDRSDELLSGLLSSPVIKRSVSISGHSTSVSLEQPFWDELLSIVEQDKTTLSELVAHIDAMRQINLSSALRLYILYRLKS